MLVIINNRNLFTWLKAMVESLEGLEGLSEIVILDNLSTYEPLLDWYSTLKHKVVFLGKNLGHHALYKSGFLENTNIDYYIYTDPDLDLSRLPKDTLLYMKIMFDELYTKKLFKHKYKIKLGLGLDWTSVPTESKYYEWCSTYEKGMHLTEELLPGVHNSPVDTTFAIYNRKYSQYYDVGGARTTFPYCVRHLPWEIITPDEEFTYYIERANESCSYKKKKERIS